MRSVVAFIERIWVFLALSAGVAVASLLLTAFVSGTTGPITLALIHCVLVVGLYVLVGNSGVLSFGQIGFTGMAAYVTAILTIPVLNKELLLPSLPGFLSDAQTGAVPAILLGALLAGIVAVVVAFPLMRLSGLTAGIATFAVLVIVNNVLNNLTAITGGSGALSGIPFETTVPLALAFAILAIGVAFAFQSSRWGLMLRASREDDVTARALGIRVYRYRRVAFVISAILSGIGGGLYALYVGAISPSAFYVELTFLTLAMLVIGGTQSLTGAVLGTAVVSLVTDLLRRGEQGIALGSLDISLPSGLNQFTLAALLLAVLLFRPGGIVGGREVPWPWRRRDNDDSSSVVDDAVSASPPAGETRSQQVVG